MIRVAAFTGGSTMSSARFRIRQLIAPLRHAAIDVTEYIARFSSWPPPNHWIRPIWFPVTIGQRLPAVLGSHRHDLTILQREMVSTFVTLEGLTKSPRVIDVDDAVWLHPRGSFFKRLLAKCDAAICGNNFLATYVNKYVPKTLILPTLVDTIRFKPTNRLTSNSSRPIIGWSGLHAGSKYLLTIERPLVRLLDKYPDAILRIVSDRKVDFSILPQHKIQFIQWTPEVEVKTLQDITIGLMPIDDSLWSRGKCSYKMLLYMACGIPVVVSPYGMNGDVLSKGDVGYGPKSEDEWFDAMSALIDDSTLRSTFGNNARSVVHDYYSISSQLHRLVDFLKDISNE